MKDQITLVSNAVKSKDLEYVAPGVFRLKILFVNVYFIESSGKWAIIDAGLWGAAPTIIKTAEAQFGKEGAPEAIFLTHGHFDHIGAINNLMPHWKVPIYAHPLEFPYLTGRSNYPPPDPTAGGGAMTAMSWMFPNNPIDIAEYLRVYASDTLPGFPEWKIYHTPGHAPGHVSFFRESDRTLIAGDAFVTVKQESLSDVISQKQKVHGPPAYFTCDWVAAQVSVDFLTALNPEIAACGHGVPMHNPVLDLELKELALNFETLAVPARGRYVKQPAITDEYGVEALPPIIAKETVSEFLIIGTAVAITAGIISFILNRKR